MDNHYCDIFSDCYRCSAPFCPYEKYDDDRDGADEEENEEGDPWH